MPKGSPSRAVLGEEMAGEHRLARAEAAIGLLQRDDIGIDLAQHLERAFGPAPPIGADRLAHIVAGDLDHAPLIAGAWGWGKGRLSSIALRRRADPRASSAAAIRLRPVACAASGVIATATPLGPSSITCPVRARDACLGLGQMMWMRAVGHHRALQVGRRLSRRSNSTREGKISPARPHFEMSAPAGLQQAARRGEFPAARDAIADMRPVGIRLADREADPATAEIGDARIELGRASISARSSSSAVLTATMVRPSP
jgi:hypothetical protein